MKNRENYIDPAPKLCGEIELHKAYANTVEFWTALDQHIAPQHHHLSCVLSGLLSGCSNSPLTPAADSLQPMCPPHKHQVPLSLILSPIPQAPHHSLEGTETKDIISNEKK